MTSKDTDKSTSSPGSEGSRLDCEWQAGPMTDLFGQAWLNAGPVGCLERMLLDTLRWASTECFLTWKPVNTPQGRLVFRLVPSMLRTVGSGSGLWPTAQAASGGTHTGITPETALKELERGNQIGLAAPAMAMWPTPNTAIGGGERSGNRAGTGDLNYEARMWPTPHSNASTGAGSQGRDGGDNLQTQTAMWATPMERDHWMTNNPRKDGRQVQITNQAAEAHRSGMTTPSSGGGGALNPEFVSWLMGYPPEWLNCAPLAMPSSRKSSRK